jgi:hypothetical protein
MRNWMTAATIAATAMTGMTVAGVAQADDGEEGSGIEPVVYGQRGITLEKGQLRPEGALVLSKTFSSDIAFGIIAMVDWAPIDKLEIGVTAAQINLTPEAEYGDTRLGARYKLLDGGFQLAAEAGFTFSNDKTTHGHAIDIGVPLRFFLNKAARLDIGPRVALNLPASGSGDKLRADLELAVGLAVSLTRNIYLDVKTGLVAPEFKFDQASIPLSLEVGYSIEGDGGAAWIDIFLRGVFPTFLYLGDAVPGFLDTVNLNPWVIGLGARLHFGLE